MSELEYQIRNWRVFDWIGGGRLVEAHCHELDVMDWAMQDHPVEANGMGGRQCQRGRRFGTDYDHHFHEYTYVDGTKMYSQCRQMNGCWGPMTEHIHTDETVVDLMGKIRISNVRDRKEEVLSPYLREHSDLLDAIWNDKPYNEGWFGATSSFTSVLGREASYSGQVVRWDELSEKGPALFPADLTEAIEAKHVVELGTANGYSAMWFCLALRETGGKLTTHEIDPQRIAMAKENFRRAGVESLATLVEGDAHETIKKLQGPIDVVLLDAEKEGFCDYLEKLLPLVRKGGLIIAHDSSGQADQLEDYFTAITENPNLETVMVDPSRWGVCITRKMK